MNGRLALRETQECLAGFSRYSSGSYLIHLQSPVDQAPKKRPPSICKSYGKCLDKLVEIVYSYDMKQRRFQMKLLTKAIAAKLPKLYQQDGKGDEAIVYAKFFTPDAQWTWYVTEGEMNEDGDFEFFGLTIGFEAELGYFNLSQLQEVRGQLGLPIERDLHFKRTTMGEVRKLEHCEIAKEEEPPVSPTRGDAIYAEMQEEKVFVDEKMSCFSEWKEGLDAYKRAMMSTASSTARRLDEWANKFNMSISELIAELDRAAFMKEQGVTA